jgi:hypothetical protein
VIKVDAPGKFAAADKDKLPPVYPFFGQHTNSFSSVDVDDEVWLLSCSDNKRQLHWFRKDNYEEANLDLMNGKNVDILVNRESGAGWATLMFEDGQGWIIRNNDGKINVRKDGSILLDSGDPHRVIDICSDSISLGSVGGSKHKAAYGDEVQQIFESVYAMMQTLKVAAGQSSFTAHLVPAIESQITNIKTKIPLVTSENVTLD